jgi:hypothetical protein
MEELSALLEKVVANWVAIWLVVSSTVAAAAAIAALTPSPKDGSRMARIRKAIDIFGGNWGFAKNDKTKKTE